MGVLSLAGKVPRVLVTPTDDLGVVLNAVHGISMEGTVNFPTGVQVRSRDEEWTRAGLHAQIRDEIVVSVPLLAKVPFSTKTRRISARATSD